MLFVKKNYVRYVFIKENPEDDNHQRGKEIVF